MSLIARQLGRVAVGWRGLVDLGEMVDGTLDRVCRIVVTRMEQP